MLDKLKAVVQIKEELDGIKSKVEGQVEIIGKLDTQIQEMKKFVDEFQKQQKQIFDEQKNIIQNFQKDKNNLSEQIENLKEEVYNFKLLKSQVQNKIMEKFEHELHEQLKLQSETLKTDVDQYKDVKTKISETATHLATLNEQVMKLKEISSKIKQEDFELTRVMGKVAAQEREKQFLKERLDKAERFAANARRRN